MTVDELLQRIRTSSLDAVIKNIAADAFTAKDFVLTLGPHLIGPLLREERRKHGLVAITSRGVPKPRPDWSRLDWQRWTDWMGRAERGVREGKQFGGRIVKAFGSETALSYGRLRARLSPEDAARLDKLCGKLLVA